jgi:hypothetical protein
VPLDAVRAGHGMPIHPSYDFVDVLSRASRLELLKHSAPV